MIPPASGWRVVSWPDKGPGFIEWARDEATARKLFEALKAADVCCALIMPAVFNKRLAA